MGNSTSAKRDSKSPSKRAFSVSVPESGEMHAQADEYFNLFYQGKEQVLKLHDYAEIYQVPGLYQHLLLDILADQSPATLSSLLSQQVSQSGASLAALKVLDMGAGIGLSGKSLAQNGVQFSVGLDILPEARFASQRDLPDTYQDYYVADLSSLPDHIKVALNNHQFNCLVCCSALTCHLPIQAFIEAFNLIADDGWIAFNVGEAKLDPAQSSQDSFYQFFKCATEQGMFQVSCIHPYQHRRSMNGNPIYYSAVVGRKRRNFFWA